MDCRPAAGSVSIPPIPPCLVWYVLWCRKSGARGNPSHHFRGWLVSPPAAAEDQQTPPGNIGSTDFLLPRVEGCILPWTINAFTVTKYSVITLVYGWQVLSRLTRSHSQLLKQEKLNSQGSRLVDLQLSVS